MKRLAGFALSAFAGLVLGVVLGLLVLMPGLDQNFLCLRSQNRELENEWKSLQGRGGELVTVRWRVHALYCIDKQKNKIQLGPVGLWAEQSYACWRVRSDVLAGYNWSDLKISRKGKEVFLHGPRPIVLGMDYKGAELLFSKNWSGLELSEQDFPGRVRPMVMQNAEKLGILKDAERQLQILAGALSRKIDLPVQVR